MLRLLPSASDRLEQIRLRDLLSAREVPRSNLRVDLHARVRRDEVVCTHRQSRIIHPDETIRTRTRDIVPLQDAYPALHDRVVLHVAHADHLVNLGDPQPVQDVGHERLEAHVLDACDELRGLEVLVRGVAAALAQVVHEVPEATVSVRRNGVGEGWGRTLSLRRGHGLPF